MANHHYTIHQSSNLMSGFTILQEHIPFDPDVKFLHRCCVDTTCGEHIG
jgi:hypothetical protein